MIDVTTRFKVQSKPKRKARSERPGMSALHLRNVRALTSCISGKMPCEPHHLRCGPAAKERGIGLKPTDRYVVPLTHEEHMACHAVASTGEEMWFASYGVDAISMAEKLWEAGDDIQKMRRIVERAE
jgi:hypothetical protein